MGAASRYWTMVSINAAGRREVEEVVPLQAFFHQQFSELAGQIDVPDHPIQRQLLRLLRENSELTGGDHTSQRMAEYCLRCFISNQIKQVCIQLEEQFGKEHGFTGDELFPFVLHDTIRAEPQVSGRFNQSYDTIRAEPRVSGRFNQSYDNSLSLATEILRTFDLERSSLAHWTSKLVKQHKELNTFLLEHGIYRLSDWAILNDTTSSQLQRILTEFHYLTPFETQSAVNLLESYHAVYRRDRLQQHQAGVKCSLPTHDQQCQIAHRLSQQVNITLSAAAILTQLQNLAQRLRQYRVYVKVGIFPTKSIDNPETQVKADHLQPHSINDSGEHDEQIAEFLKSYRKQFKNCLDQAIEQVTCKRYNHLQRKDSQKAQKFLAALDLFYCQGKSMGEIAPLVGLQAQYQVTRLLKLRDYRADIRQQMFKSLLSRIIEIAKEYSDPESLYNLEQKIEVALDEQLETTFCEAETEASTKRTQSSISLFAQRVCRYLNTMRDLL